MGSVERLAELMVGEWNRRLPEYRKWFEERGFTRETINDPEVLFRLLATVSYLMRPFPSDLVWIPVGENPCEKPVMQVFAENGVTRRRVRSVNQEELQAILSRLRVRNIPLHRVGAVNHARSLIELERKLPFLQSLLRAFSRKPDAVSFREAIDQVHGFGLVLSAKT